jgi:hypothetical protein
VLDILESQMSMHLEGPWLSTTGKRRGKQKFRNAAEAKKARELEESWKALQKKWQIEEEDKRRQRALKAEPLSYALTTPVDRSTRHIPSLNTGAAVAAKVEPLRYTGTKIKGIGVMHKSNSVPIFSDEEAVDIAKMRR